jgi:hypothetical protein
MAAENQPERRKPWEERNALVAGVLAYLIPGAGHLYQGRYFKGVLYFVCILGTFFGGMKLGEGAVVYHAPTNNWGISLNYLAQVCVGLPALPAWKQAQRAKEPGNKELQELRQPLSAPFTGQLITTGPDVNRTDGVLDGEVRIETVAIGGIPTTRGTFRGTLDGQPVELALAGGLKLAPAVGAGFQRRLECNVARTPDLHPRETVMIRGVIPRPWKDAYCAPPDAATIQDLHGRLGKFYDLAIAFTMIAGLLNVLAIWDAIEGPAYGFGDEPAPIEPPPTGGKPAEAVVAATAGSPSVS